MRRSLFSPHKPDIIAQEIVDDLEAALEQFRLIANDLGEGGSKTVA
jgi:type I restriction enzyme M protein